MLIILVDFALIWQLSTARDAKVVCLPVNYKWSYVQTGVQI